MKKGEKLAVYRVTAPSFLLFLIADGVVWGGWVVEGVGVVGG